MQASGAAMVESSISSPAQPALKPVRNEV
jgi:hypothetical protein